MGYPSIHSFFWTHLALMKKDTIFKNNNCLRNLLQINEFYRPCISDLAAQEARFEVRYG